LLVGGGLMLAPGMESTSTSVPQRPSLLPTALIGLGVLAVAVLFASTSSWYFTFKAVHILFAVIWIGGGTLLTILALIAERQDDADQLAALARQAAMVGEKLFTPAALIVLAMGIAMMINLNWGWGHFWIVFGLLGFASTFVVGLGILAPMTKKIDALMQTSGPEHPETQALIKRLLLVARFDTAVLILVIIDMTVKPFS
jgi:uncharacterized membrane protein